MHALTDFGALFEDDDADFVARLPLQLLEADGGAESSRASADDANIDVVLGPLNGDRIKRIREPGPRGVYPTAPGPFYRLQQAATEHRRSVFTVNPRPVIST